MVKTETENNGSWTGYMDGYLKSALDRCKEVIKSDWDMIFCIDGYEGSGKSVIAQQMAKYVDPTLDINRIVFNHDDFIKSINKAEPYTAIVFDEAFGSMASRSSMSIINKTLNKVLAEIRQKNLWVFIVLPCFFELDKYPAIWRSRALIHVYTKNFERGYFAFWNQDRKKTLYIMGKKFYSYKKPNQNFYGRFTKGYAVEEEAYRKKKLQALKENENKEELTGRQEMWKERYCILAAKLREYIPTKDIAKIIDIDKMTGRKHINMGKEYIKVRALSNVLTISNLKEETEKTE